MTGRPRRRIDPAHLRYAVDAYRQMALYRVAQALAVTPRWLKREMVAAGIRLRSPGEAVRLMIRDRPEWHRHFQRRAS